MHTSAVEIQIWIWICIRICIRICICICSGNTGIGIGTRCTPPNHNVALLLHLDVFNFPFNHLNILLIPVPLHQCRSLRIRPKYPNRNQQKHMYRKCAKCQMLAAKCANAKCQMHKCEVPNPIAIAILLVLCSYAATNAKHQIHKCTNAQMLQVPNAKMPKMPNPQMPHPHTLLYTKAQIQVSTTHNKIL